MGRELGVWSVGILLLAASLGGSRELRAGDEPPTTGASEPRSSLAQVFLADGTSLSLSGWSLSYEYQAVPPGASRGLVRPARLEARELWLGKGVVPLVGRTLEIRYKVVEVERSDAEGTGQQQAQEAEALALTAPGGKAKQLRLEPPADDRLRGSEAKNAVIYPLGVDLRGTTLTGTARQLCLVSYSAFGECHPADDERVVRIVFVN
jgi:hypothetical protein